MTTAPPAVVTDGLTRDFGAVRAVDGLSLMIPVGQVSGLLGHNGAGKTTTIRVLNGLLSPTAGGATVLGLDPRTHGPQIRARTGVLTENPSLDERLTARENLAFAGLLFGVDRSRVTERVDRLLADFGLGERADDRTAGFSRGMKQRLALARALIHDPELIFLDEPTAALDPVAARDVHESIRAMAAEQRRTVVITTHNLVEAQRLCDRVVILRHGRSIADGTPTDLSRQLAGTGRVEIEVGTGQADLAAATVADGGHGASATMEGDVVLVDGVGREGLPRVVEKLVAAGVHIYRVTPSEPSLEDAYFALHADDGQ
jgi:ABC-2 type transport system ATP-binding protein